ncbi:MAG TPA: insulinase family protein [Oscillatoriaceae cyanobacterium]
MRARFRLTMAVLLAAATPALAAEHLAGIGVFRLPAGFELVTSEDHAKPQVALDTCVLAGSREGCPGVAEATAEAIWHGGAHPLDKALQALGGAPDMLVTREGAHFWVTLPADKLVAALDLIGAGLAAPDWQGLDLASLHAHLQPQADAVSYSPWTQADSRLLALLGDARLAAPPVGTPQSDARLTLADLQAFYARHYLPSRIKVALVGDFATGPTVGQVVRGYAALLKHEAPTGTAPACPPAPASATALPADLVEAGALGAPSTDAAGQATMAVLARAIAAELTTRMPPAHVTVNWVPMRNRGMLTISVAGVPGTLAESTIRTLAAELAAKPVALDVYTHAIQAELARYAASNATLAQRAANLADFAAIASDARRASAYPDLVSAVGREDLVDAARQYLTPDALRIIP